MFRDREDAGKKLAARLRASRGTDTLVLAIPCGGVPVGFEVARGLDAELSIVVARKLPFPENPESGFGAVAEDGSRVVLSRFVPYLSKAVIREIVREQTEEIERRIRVLRGGEELPRIRGRTVVLVDDGIAMGSTMQAAIRLCRRRGPGTLIVGAPVASCTVRRRLAGKVDGIVILEEPPDFRAVAQVYARWYDVPDTEVLRIMDRWRGGMEHES